MTIRIRANLAALTAWLDATLRAQFDTRSVTPRDAWRRGTDAVSALRGLANGIACCVVLALAACVAPRTSADSLVNSPADPPAAQAPVKPPRMSEPLPAQRVPDSPRLDTSCRTSADCAVKDVGNCCGRMPACVNVASPVDPAAVQAQCAKQGRMGVCGFRAISACQCNAGRCEPAEPDQTGQRPASPAAPAAPDHPVR